jgi:hypothetical protein
MAFPRFQVSLFNARVFRRPAPKPKVVGHVRRGTLVPAGPPLRGRGCPGGRWHRIPGGGHICTSLGFEVSQAPLRFRGPAQRAPDASRAVPFRYAKVIRQGAPLLRRRPTPREVLQREEAAAKQVAWPAVVQRHMTGIYILAIDRADRVGDRDFYRTVRGQYVRAEDLEFKKRPRMRGRPWTTTPSSRWPSWSASPARATVCTMERCSRPASWPSTRGSRWKNR